ncbi:hypothetical protein PENSTE_c014G03236 [Penicillium steckii]|uniref:Uncharacterized protein n=1 Tax=Penicillium steckii TaxID=303698 RepID=A0A1V6T119_9EURO|nr:hypothetical protein PENSTE_c014G03236 [Penicillium steckii]
MHKFNRAVFRTNAKLNWMILNLLAPEWSLAKAWADHRSVSFVEDKFKNVAEVDDVQWKKCHSHFANLGGFVISFAAVTPSLSARGSRTSSDLILASRSSATGALLPEPDSVSTVEPMPESDIPMREYLADGASFSNQHPDILESAPSLESEIGHGSTSLQRYERDRYHHMHNLTDQPLSTHNTGSPSLVEIGQFSSRVISNVSDISLSGTHHNGESLPLPLQKQLDRIKRHRPINSIPDYLQRLSHTIGPIKWIPHDLNTRSVVQSLEEVQLDHFKTPWEQMRFSRMQYFWMCNVHRLLGDRWVVDANQLFLARELGIIKRLPSLSTEEIEDRSTADLLIKSIALIQIAWFLVQVITRLCSQGVTTSPLEIMTLAFAISTAFTYLLLLDKPKDVQKSVIINATRYATSQEIARLGVAGPSGLYFSNNSAWIPNNAVHATDNLAYNADLLHSATFSVFILGAIHCIGWNFTRIGIRLILNNFSGEPALSLQRLPSQPSQLSQLLRES